MKNFRYLYLFLAFAAIFAPGESRCDDIKIIPIPKNQVCLKTVQNGYSPIEKTVLKAIFEEYDLLENLNKTLFNTAILKKPEDTRVILDQLPMHLGSGSRGAVLLKSDPRKKIPYTYFNRGSNELVVIGGGFANPREMLAPLLGIFVDYDVVIFDHIGHGLDYSTSYIPGWILKKMLDIDFTALEGGQQEEDEILSITEYFKTKKTYKNVYGVGFCYSTGLFIRTAANNPGLFKKLILDGAWENGQALMNRFAEKPELFYDPQRGNPSETTMSWRTYLLYRAYMYLSKTTLMQRHIRGSAANLNHNQEALKKLENTPILYVHGSNDLVISSKQFNGVWEHKAGKKTAIITDARHLQNHIKYKQLFSWSANCFLDLGPDALEYSLQSPEKLKQTYSLLEQVKENKQLSKKR
ncbi:alpha/beta hydrolase [Candidatus Dependentiae bacterium]|nr:alpha/beta hydrolase [Candidatus Dependentiae bacterium]